MPDVCLEVGGAVAPLSIRINGPDPTFVVATDKIMAQAVSDLDTRLLDIVDIAAAVFAADGTVKRGGDTRPAMGQGWRRQFAFTIPVRHPELWSRPDVTTALIDAVEFLTEDHVAFKFVAGENIPALEPSFNFDPASGSFRAEDVVMFSGGLDSFAGALELLATTTTNVVLLTHRSAQKAIPRQGKLGEHLADKFPGRVLHIQILARRKGDESRDNTQRSRSFLFAALGQLVAKTFGAKRICFFENGIVSHNLPLTPQIVGTMATRTTHPLSLHKLNKLFDLVAPDFAPIENRYQWLTKTEVVRRIAENNQAPMISKTVSCTSIREQNKLHTHCGACSQCLDRRFAVLAAGLEQYDFATDYQTDVLFGERSDVRSKTLALEWTRHALQLRDLDQTAFMSNNALEIARVIQGHPELTSQAALQATYAMHRRHSEAVAGVLEKVTREDFDDLIGARIPATSLLALLLGQAPTEPSSVPKDPRSDAPRPEVIDDIDEVDFVPDPNAPLQVSFLVDREGHFVVAVRGLGRVNGQPARVPHALKPAYDADKREELTPEQFRYQVLMGLPMLENVSKDAARQNVARLRKELARSFEDLHGNPPSGHLLVQSKRPRGFRLDPLIEIQPPDDSL